MRKIKGIPFWEQYLEFMVIGAVLVVLVLFVAMQFIGSGNVVSNLKPSDVNEKLGAEARRLDAMLSPDAGSTTPSEPALRYDEFSQRLAASVGGAQPLPQLYAFVPIEFTGVGVGTDIEFVEPTLPAPTRAIAVQHFDSLADGVVEQYDELRGRFTQPPHDVSWMTVGALFDRDAILRRLREGGNSGGPAPIPASWLERVFVVNVKLERETYANGQFGNRRVVDVLPSQFHLRSELEGTIGAGMRDSILTMLRDDAVQRQLIQPTFLPTRNGSWLPPDMTPEKPGRDLEDDQIDAEKLIRERQRLVAERENVRRELGDLGDPAPTPGPTPGPTPRGPGGPIPPPSGPPGGGGGLGGPQQPGGGGAGGGARPVDENRRRELNRRLVTLDRRILNIERVLQQHNINYDRDSIAPTEIDARLVWAHDMDIEPGKTYRYRIVVEAYNPFFARKMNLIPAQQHLADSFTLVSQPGEWSEPIYVRPPIQTFITRASVQAQGSIGGDTRRATAEVYRYFDGRWWSQQFNLEPGNRIGGVHRDPRRAIPAIDYSAEWFVVDVIEDLDSGSRGDGRNARVVLQRIGADPVIEFRHPIEDSSNPTRQRLRDEVRMAEAEQSAQ